MSTHDHHDHEHLAVDTTLVRRLRFLKLCLDTLLLPDNDNREQAYKAAIRQLEIIGVINANQTPSEAMNGWVYATEFMTALEPDVMATPLPDEVSSFFLRVEALSGMPLKGREEVYAQEQARLQELSVEKPVAGLMRIIMLCKRMVNKRSNFTAVGISTEEVFTSQHLINKDLMDWRNMGMKPHWFSDEFLVFRDSDSERTELPEDEMLRRATIEEELIFKLFMIRHDSPEGINLKKFYKRKIAEELAKVPVEDIGERTDEQTKS